jgi:hypothetical protein
MSVKYHFSNGCSFSTKKKSYSAHQWLAHNHGVVKENMFNCAKGGRGNDRIVQTTMQFFIQYPERIKDTTVSIGWTTPYRWDYCIKITPEDAHNAKVFKGVHKSFDWQWQTWHLALPDTEPSRFFMDWSVTKGSMDLELTHAVKLYTQIYMLQTFFKLHKIKYVMYHALTNDCPVDSVNGIKRPQLKTLRDAIDKKHFFNFEPSPTAKKMIEMQQKNRSSSEHRYSFDGKYTQSHFEYVAKNGLGKSISDAHPNPQGHKKWGAHLTKFVKQNGLFSN